MRIEAAIEYADQLLYERTGRHLSDLQNRIIHQSCQGRTYSQVATAVGYSEGHIKDVASQLWQLLSEALGERITKGNLRSRLINRLKRTVKSATPTSLHPLMSSSAARVSAVLAADSVLASHPVELLQNSSIDNASVYTPAIESADFIGRAPALQALTVLSQTHRMIVIQGEGGLGKTTLAQQYVQRFERVLELPMAKESANITPAESVVEEWLRQHFNEEPGSEFGVTLSRLKQHLHQAGQLGILIDNLEPALDGNGQFIAEHRHYVELLRALADAGVSVIVTSRDRLCEPGIKVHHYRLPGLTLASWQQFFSAGFSATGVLPSVLSSETPSEKLSPASSEILEKMHRAYGGNAKAMEILCSSVVEDFEGDLSAYWQENGCDLLGPADLRNLIVSQVNRLQTLDADAYRVFCRLGCYRYQLPQPRLTAEALAALMWDIDSARHRQTLNSLRDRSLLEFRKGDYWLHPVSRAEAIARLREGEDWQRANQAAAQYWRASVTSISSVEDGLQALEAYYHLMAAEDYDSAAAVLLQSRDNQWQQFLPLASSLYRMGLLQPVVSAITQVLPLMTPEREPAGQLKGQIKSQVKNQLRNQQRRSELNNILGDVYWITGRIHSAIACQQQTLADTPQLPAPSYTQPASDAPKSGASVEALETYYRKMLIVDAYLSIGLYCIDLWELAQAAQQFEQVIALADQTPHQAWADKATVGLALVRAYLGQTQVAAKLANSLYGQFTAAEQPGRYAYFVQLLGQAFNSLGELDKAQVLYERAIAFAEAGHYVQVKAKALTGLATLQRKRGDVEGAIALHTQATALSEAIGAKCDLAEAYFQFGLSVGVVNESKEADSQFAYFERAIALFSDICAPHQLHRIAVFQTQEQPPTEPTLNQY